MGSIFYAISGLFTLAAAWHLYAGLFRDRAKGRRRCPKCGYDMRASPTLLCPECGHEAKRDADLFRARRHWRLAAIGVACAVLAWYVEQVRHRFLVVGESLRYAVVPTIAYPISFDWIDAKWEQAAILRFGIEGSKAEPKAWGWQCDLLARRLAADIKGVDKPRDLQFGGFLQSLSVRSDRAAVEAVRLLGSPGLVDPMTRRIIAKTLSSNRVYLLPDLARLAGDADAAVATDAWNAIGRITPQHLAQASEADLASAIVAARRPRHPPRAAPFRVSADMANVEPLAAELARRGPRGAAALRPIVEDEAKVFDPDVTGRVAIGPLCLAALRRAQNEPPPLVVHIPEEPLTFKRNGAVKMRVELVNQENEFPMLAWVVQNPKFEVGPLGHFRVNLRPVGDTPHRSLWGSRAHFLARVEPLDIPPGRPTVVQLDLIQFTPLSRPGTYDVRIEHDSIFRIFSETSARTTTTPAVTRRIELPAFDPTFDSDVK